MKKISISKIIYCLLMAIVLFIAGIGATSAYLKDTSDYNLLFAVIVCYLVVIICIYAIIDEIKKRK